MEVNIKDLDNKKYIKLVGDLDGVSSNEVTEKILEVAENNNNIVSKFKLK